MLEIEHPTIVHISNLHAKLQHIPLLTCNGHA